MKKIVNVLGSMAAFITSILIICTFTTTYQFYYVGQIFNSYLPIQLGVCLTMMILGVRFLLNETGKKRILYATLSFVIAISLVFFMVNFVK
jgi:small basic protein